MKKLLKLIPYMLIGIGLSSMSLALIADLVGFGGQGGIGTKQIVLLLVGVLLFFFGISLIIPVGRQAYDRLLHPTDGDQALVPMKSKRDKFLVIMTIGAWFGLVNGYAETVFRLIRKFIFGDILGMSQHFGWMIPLADLVLFCVIGLMVFVIALLWKKAATVGFIAFIFTFFMVMSVYYVKPRIAWYAAFLLAGGIALQMAQFLSKRQGGFYKIVRNSLPWMAGVVVGIAVMMNWLF